MLENSELYSALREQKVNLHKGEEIIPLKS
jgi:hypothetical protein